MTASTPPLAFRDRAASLLNGSRAVIFLELLLITVLVLLPLNFTALYLLLLGWLSLWLRRKGWRQIGMARLLDWRRTIFTALGAAVLYQAFSIFIIVSILEAVTNTPLDLSQFAPLKGNVAFLVVSLIVGWTLAAFGEEMAYRGYVLNRAADLFGRSNSGWVVGVILSSLLFGYSHLASQGTVGLLETTITGLVAATLYILSGRNLWLPILFHGLIDTIGLLLIFAGLYPLV